MNIFTVSFFGHRHIENPLSVEKQLSLIIHRLLEAKEYTEFLVGMEGDFDSIVSACIRKAKRKYFDANSSHILVLPYKKAKVIENFESYKSYYDEIEICSKAATAHPKRAIEIRNREMIGRSDMVVFYVARKSGGAYKALRYAKNAKVELLDLTDCIKNKRDVLKPR